MLITASNISKSFNSVDYLFKNINLGISYGDRIGIVGVNGSGKTTLMNIITGLDNNYEGNLNRAKSVRIGYLNQILNFSSEDTLYTESKKAFKDVIVLQKKLNELEKIIDNTENVDDDIHMEYSHYLSLLHDSEGYNIDYKIEKVLNGLGFTEKDYHRKLTTFSGGERRRALFARILLEDNNILVLDEPTNHLDIPAIEWVRDFINSYEGAVVLISHDKNFLNSTVNKILEIELGNGSLYKGNFNDFIVQKMNINDLKDKEYEAQQKYIKKTKEFIRKNIAGQKTKQAQGRRKQLERLDLNESSKTIKRDISVKNLLKCKRSGNIVANIENISVSFDDNQIINNADFKIYRNEKVAFVGNNGIGKTTLLKALVGEIQPDKGKAELGYNVEYAYFTQNTSDLSLEGSLIDYIDKIRPDLKESEIRTLLARFYFTGDKVFEDASILSGGEKTRLALMEMILKDTNLLLLDEPTNHLDIYTVESLGKIIKDYPGNVIAISHDINFIDTFAEKIILMYPNHIQLLTGNFSDNYDYIMDKLSLGRISKQYYKKTSNKDTTTKKKQDKKQPKKKNLNVYKINKLEEEISELETELEGLQKKLYDPDIASDYTELTKVQNRIKEIENSIEEKMEEWEEYHDVE